MSHDKPIAVAVIHGMGSQGDRRPAADEITFSKGLHTALGNTLDAAEWNRVAYREIFWADLLQERQETYLGDIRKTGARWMWLRDFVMHRLTDAAAYRQTYYTKLDLSRSDLTDKEREAAEEDIYRQIHGRVAETIKALQEDTGPDTPLLIFAHSLGGHIISSYTYDMQKKREVISVTSDFQRLKTMVGLLTFGCNIPIFTFDLPRQKVTPIDYPGTNIPKDRMLMPWWLNLNDRDDVLGMPLGPAGDGYATMIESGEIEDRWINVGSIATSWNPFSHNAYWTDRDFYKQAAGMIRQALAIAEAA